MASVTTILTLLILTLSSVSGLVGAIFYAKRLICRTHVLKKQWLILNLLIITIVACFIGVPLHFAVIIVEDIGENYLQELFNMKSFVQDVCEMAVCITVSALAVKHCRIVTTSLQAERPQHDDRRTVILSWVVAFTYATILRVCNSIGMKENMESENWLSLSLLSLLVTFTIMVVHYRKTCIFVKYRHGQLPNRRRGIFHIGTPFTSIRRQFGRNNRISPALSRQDSENPSIVTAAEIAISPASMRRSFGENVGSMLLQNNRLSHSRNSPASTRRNSRSFRSSGVSDHSSIDKSGEIKFSPSSTRRSLGENICSILLQNGQISHNPGNPFEPGIMSCILEVDEEKQSMTTGNLSNCDIGTGKKII